MSTPRRSPTIDYLHQISVTSSFHGFIRRIASLPSFHFTNVIFTSSAMSFDDVSFGPKDQEWHYSKSTKTYNLSGRSTKKMTIPTTEGPKETSVIIDPDSSVLVIVDMQNFFLDPQCMDHPNGLKAVEPTIKAIEKCRETGIQVQFPHKFPILLAST
jgi:hypothetical protein